MNEDLTYHFYQYLLIQKGLPSEYNIIKTQSEEIIDEVMKVTEEFVKDCLHKSMNYSIQYVEILL